MKINSVKKLKIFRYNTYEGDLINIRMLSSFKRGPAIWEIKSKSGVLMRDIGGPTKFLDSLASTGTLLHYSLDRKGEKELKYFWEKLMKFMRSPSPDRTSFWKDVNNH